MSETEDKKEKVKNKGTYINRLLKALAEIYEDPKAAVPEKLQATRLALDALERRPVPKRKTDKDKLLEKALKDNQKKKLEKDKK